MPDVIVVGAGVVGSTTALYLAREGLSVTVIDSRAEAGLETSFANGGLVTPSTALPWCSPAVPGLLFKWIGRESAPLLLRPSAIPSLGLWGLKFLANCRPSKHAASSLQLTRFGRESLEETEGLLAQRTVDYTLSHGGLLELFRDEAGVATRDAYANFLEGLGVRTVRLDEQACVALEPHLAAIAPSIRGALHLPDDAWGDARKFTLAVEKAAREVGVEFAFGTEINRIDAPSGKVTGVETNAGRFKARTVVVCAGAFTKHLLKPLGISVPIAPVKGYSISIPRGEFGFLPGLPIVDDTARLGVTPLGDHLRVAGTVEFDGYNRTVRPRRVQNLVAALKSLFPDAAVPANLSPWCGFRPMSADGKPIIDRTPVEGLFINSGHGALGWTLACGSARLITNKVTGKPGLDGRAFALDRSFI
jgi:D-amino-acid dehydrogenase